MPFAQLSLLSRVPSPSLTYLILMLASDNSAVPKFSILAFPFFAAKASPADPKPPSFFEARCRNPLTYKLKSHLLLLIPTAALPIFV